MNAATSIAIFKYCHSARDEIASFESTKSVLDLISPVSGTIHEVNGKLSQSPELANKDPYGEGWFAIIKLADFESDRENLLQARDYFEVLKRKVETERKKLGSARERARPT